MDFEFHKKTLPYLQTIARKPQTQEQTQEVRLPEGMPDIGNVVSSWAQVILRGKEWRGDRIGVNGGVMAWVMYLPEEENIPQAVATWMPFQMKWDIPQNQREGTICAKPFLQSVDARSLSARKLMVRAGFGVDVEALVPGEAEVYSPVDLPEDIRILQKTYPLCLPAEAGEKPFSVEECFVITESLPKPQQMVRSQVHSRVTEWKLMADKLVFRGSVSAGALYRGEDGNLHTWHQEIPFSQYAELDREFDDHCDVQIDCIVTNLELDILEDGQLCLKAGFSAQYKIFTQTMVDLVEDACSSVRHVTPQLATLSLPAVLDRQTQTLRVEQTMETDAAQVLDLCFHVDEIQQMREAEALQIRIPGTFQLLYTDPEGNYQTANGYGEETVSLAASEDVNTDVSIAGADAPVVTVGSNGVSMLTDLSADMVTTAGQGLPMVVGLEMGEERMLDPNRPSLILRRAGTDSLWQLAKKTGSTVEAIQSANNLEGEAKPDQMLLIPIL